MFKKKVVPLQRLWLGYAIQSTNSERQTNTAYNCNS